MAPESDARQNQLNIQNSFISVTGKYCRSNELLKMSQLVKKKKKIITITNGLNVHLNQLKFSCA